MNVNLVMTTTDKLKDEPIQDGKLIYTADKPGHYYDAGGIRLNVNSIQFVNNLPAVGELNVLYVTVDGQSSGVHVWHGTGYYSFRYVDIDKTLSISGKAADAKAAGDKFADQDRVISQLPSEITAMVEEQYLEPKFEKAVFFDKMWILTDLQCGDTLPPPGTPGRLYFLKTGDTVE